MCRRFDRRRIIPPPIFFGGFLPVETREDVIDIINCFGYVIPALSRNPADTRLRGERVLSAQGLGLAGFRLKAGMTEEE
jgi:hypothetical protein